MSKKIVHLTSAHTRYDTRIFLKQCRSLAKAGHSVSLVVADGKGDEVKDGVNIYDVGASSGRMDRIRNASRKVFEKAVLLKADVYHLHDPELIPSGLKLKKLSKKIIFDSHEDVPKQMLHKPYLNMPIRLMLAWCIKAYEKWACKQFDAIVTATPFIAAKFLFINPLTIDINNYPILGELSQDTIDWSNKENKICFIGVISAERGIAEIVNALHLSKHAQLQLVGQFSEAYVEERVKRLSGWKKVNQLGFLDRGQVRDILSTSVAGLVTFHPLPNHVDSQPNKMFEYMSAGIPVIASNFSFWRDIIEGTNCGICVDPLQPEEIAKAIDFLIDNPKKAEQMGRSGQQAVQQRYNWAMEEKKLLNLYQNITKTL